MFYSEQLLGKKAPLGAICECLPAGGVVIIYNQQQLYLLEDCTDAMKKVQGTGLGSNETKLMVKRERARGQPEMFEMPDLPEDQYAPGIDLPGPNVQDHMPSNAPVAEDAGPAVNAVDDNAAGDA
ncbi:hypothetical protein WJX73_005172 [Symbiochloris irregularis]|uniref:Uncharacterized protein n=1 Tax=Symbiochloris irregularis TaxID=706552 RepID=A0AAW1P194_9CHLO